ncbi:Ribokinase [Phytophthora nicotianae]|uniref:Ribokinase n=1 Tax=Phytophthora nicotianae TaxID=4792 RepID=A0A0W8D2F4_PHYNI|nr:Ribokinase [Phytophthora nicotianae]
MTQIRRHILVVGSVGADIVVAVDRMPTRGETLSASKPDTGNVYPGGKGNNQAATIAKLIGPSHPTLVAKMACQFGNDNHGKMIKDTLESVGVDTTLCTQAKCSSGLAFVFIYPDGDNSIVIVSGANSAWPEELPASLIDAVKTAAIVLVQCEIPVRVNALVAKAAAETSVPVMWDTGGDDYPIPADILPLLTFVCPNETELARLTKREVDSIDDAVAAARFLQEQGAKDVLVTLGSLGSVFVPADGSEVLRQSAFKVDNVVDTTGAGDCYRGAFAVALAEGRAMQDCMVRASVASALCVQRDGALPSLPSADEVIAFLKANGLQLTRVSSAC